MAYVSNFSKKEIEALLPDLIPQMCPFVLTRLGSKFAIDYDPQYPLTVLPSQRGTVYSRYSFKSVASWFWNGQLINDKTFNDFYAQYIASRAIDVEELL